MESRGQIYVLQGLEFMRDELMWTFENDSSWGIRTKCWEEYHWGNIHRMLSAVLYDISKGY